MKALFKKETLERKIKMRTNKKALLLGEHVVNIIVAVLCILVLIYLGIQVYNLYLRANQEKEEAKYTLEQIVDKINGLTEGEKRDYLVINPKGWVIVYSEECGEGKCLCSCEKGYAGNLEECSKKGVCQPVSTKINIGYYCVIPGYQSKIFTECLEIDIKNIKLLRSGEDVSIGEESYFLVEKALDNALSNKDSETGKTVDELMEEYLKSQALKLKTKIEENIRNYFKENKLDILEKWELKLILDRKETAFGDKLEEGQWRGEWGPVYSEQWQYTLKKTKIYGGKEYNLVFNYIKK